MKTITPTLRILALALIICPASLSHAAGWEEVGAGSASGGGISNMGTLNPVGVFVRIAPDNRPVVVWGKDLDEYFYARRFDGANWVEVGSGSGSGNGVAAGYPLSLGVAQDGMIYVSHNLTHTSRWNNASWESLGDLSDSPFLAVGSSGVYASIEGQMGSAPSRTFFARCYELVSGVWTQLGADVASSPEGGGINREKHTGITVAADGMPIVGYCDTRTNGPLRVKKWNGSDWIQIGSDFDSGVFEGRPYLVTTQDSGIFAYWRHMPFERPASEWRIYVSQWNGGDWDELGGSASGEGISGLYSDMPSACFVPGKGFCIVWIRNDAGTGGILEGKCWDGSVWRELTPGSVGGSGIAGNANVRFPSLTADAAGNLYLSYYQRHSGVWDVYVKRYVSSESGGLNWIQRFPVSHPSVRHAPAVTYDISGKRIVLFGGIDGPDQPTSYRNDTWCWDGTNWIQQSPATVPSGRLASAMACDDTRGRIVLFGGHIGHDLNIDDTWEWDGTNWTECTPTSAPSELHGHAMSYDSARRRVVLFGGFDYSHAPRYRNETWEWDGTNWIQRSPANAPPARYLHAMAYDSARARVVVFGGYDVASRNDTWEWDGTDWIQRSPANAPPARYFHVMAYDSARRRIVMFGGYDDSPNRRNDTWEWDGMDWREIPTVNSPPARESAAMAYDQAHGRIVLFGGWNGTSSMDDTWEYGKVESGFAYEYDFLSRLTAVKPPNGITIGYEYDPAGNRNHKRVTAGLSVAAGSENPASGGVGNDSAGTPIMQLALTAGTEDGANLRGLTFEGSGTGGEATAIGSVKLWIDANGNGVVDGGEAQLGSGQAFGADNGTVSFSGLNLGISAGQRVHLLVTYDFNGTALQGQTFHTRLANRTKIEAYGASSGQRLYVLGTPVEGATLTISSDTTPPGFAGLTTATALSETAMLEWFPASDPSAPITYHIWCSESSFNGVVSGSPQYSTQDTQFLVSNLTNGQPYYFAVRAADAVGNEDANTSETRVVPQAILHQLFASADAHGSAVREPDQDVYEHGTRVDVSGQPATGYHFTHWTGDVPTSQTTSSNPLLVTMDADTSLTAHFAINTYHLWVSAGPGGNVTISPNLPLYVHGTTVTLTATPRLTNHFGAWSGDVPEGSEGSAVFILTMDGDKSVNASFAPGASDAVRWRQFD